LEEPTTGLHIGKHLLVRGLLVDDNLLVPGVHAGGHLLVSGVQVGEDWYLAYMLVKI